jgi:hypothetical protein
VGSGGGKVGASDWVGSGIGEASGEGIVAVGGMRVGESSLSPTDAGVGVGSRDSISSLVNEQDNVTRHAMSRNKASN